MKAAVIINPNEMYVQEVPIPPLKAESLLIKVAACAVCGSDIRIFESGNERVKYPAIIGHEMAGEIVDIGKGISGYKVGDRLSIGADVPCGACFWCLNGMGNCCEENYAMGYQFSGGFAEYCLIAPMVVKYGPMAVIPDGLSMEQAALAEPLACCINGIERVSFKPGKSVLVIGAGPIGLLLIQTVKAFGSPLTILADTDAARLAAAHIFQPDYAINSDAEDLASAVAEITKGRGTDVVFTACPSPEAQELALSTVAKRGAINFFGGLSHSARNISISSNKVHYKELVLTGSHGSTPTHHALALNLIASGRIDVARLITHRFSLDEIHMAFAAVKQRTGLKVVLKIN